MTTLAHVTDLHLVEDGFRARGDAARRRLEVLTLGTKKDPKMRRLRAVAALRAAWETGAEHLVVTGDLTEDGVAAQFALLAEVLDASPWPAARVTLVPGNHDAYDDVTAFGRALAGPLAAFRATSTPGARTVLGDVVVCAASTAIAQQAPRARGALDAASLEGVAIGAALAEATGRVAVAAMHHGPTSLTWGKRWIDGLIDDGAIAALMRRHDGLAVLHGHTHRQVDAAVRPGGPVRIFSTRAVVEAGSAVRVYEAKNGRLAAVEATRFARAS